MTKSEIRMTKKTNQTHNPGATLFCSPGVYAWDNDIPLFLLMSPVNGASPYAFRQ